MITSAAALDDRETQGSVRISLDGQPVEAVGGESVASALLRAGITTFTRSVKYHRPRGPFCLSGTCGQCLMRVDGTPSLPACRVRAEEGMVCERQNGPLGVDADLFRAADFLFPEGLDHHHLLTGSRVLGRVALEIARRLAGLGELPASGRPALPAQVRSERLVIVGGGPAGRAAARAAAAAKPVVIERDEGSECVGLYANDTRLSGNALVVVRRREGLLVIAAERVICANGGASQPLPFPGVDRPGVYAARGLEKLPAMVGRKLAVVGQGDAEHERAAAALSKRGYEPSLVKEPPRRALGNPVRALDLADGSRLRCDAVAIALPPAPLHELATSAGARARFDGNGFPVETDADGRTAVPWLFAAGTVAGKPAESSGDAAGRACL
ncbi:MAG TPA: 2Fe-2S iron-sulfur cluster-binding protein [Myxococcales bacterium]|nr:2Fe-2S iron-sulfur cluster-binding protein [Myxococcales bacterium]